MSLEQFAKQYDLVPNPNGEGLMVPDRSRPRSPVSGRVMAQGKSHRGGKSTPRHMMDGGGPDPTIDPIRESRTFMIPVVTVSETNQREHWSSQNRRRKKQRRGAFNIAGEWIEGLPAKPWRITLTRYGSRRMDPGNLSSSMKGPQDGVAAALKLDDDGTDGTDWKYKQHPDGRKTAFRGVGVKIETLT